MGGIDTVLNRKILDEGGGGVRVKYHLVFKISYHFDTFFCDLRTQIILLHSCETYGTNTEFFLPKYVNTHFG